MVFLKRSQLVILLLLLNCGKSVPNSDQREAKQKLQQVFAQTALIFNQRNPLNATMRGLHDWDDQLPNFFVPEFWEGVARENAALTEQLDAIPEDLLDPSDRLNCTILKGVLELEREELESGFFREMEPLCLDQLNGFLTMVCMLASENASQPFRTAQDYERFAKRLEALPGCLAGATALMRKGLEQKMTTPKVIVSRDLAVLKKMLADQAESSPFYAPVLRCPATLEPGEKNQIETRYRTLLEAKLTPALTQFVNFLQHDYLPHAREEVGMNAIPNGDKLYRQMIKMVTTTDMTAKEIHEIGVAEAERIRWEMDAVRKKMGFEGDLPALISELRSNPKYHFRQRQELLDAYRQVLAEARVKAERLFYLGQVPELLVQAEKPYLEESAPGAFYFHGTKDGSVKSAVIVNTFQPETRDMLSVPCAALLLGIPGHHYRFSLLDQLDLPEFRNQIRFSAYLDGWGHYSEFLGSEMGIYDDSYRYFGKLAMEMRRAGRLVIDTGIHAKGWTREQGIAWLLAHLPISPEVAAVEVDRYIGSPAEVLSYKIGQLKISELRNRAAAELGPKFQIKEFHREILKDGAMPLDLLERKMLVWIEQSKK